MSRPLIECRRENLWMGFDYREVKEAEKAGSSVTEEGCELSLYPHVTLWESGPMSYSGHSLPVTPVGYPEGCSIIMITYQ